jgi:ubiquinone/menaquinone biosynthesis C-methylase UbiE
MNVRDGSRETSAAWDRIWSDHSYRLASVRSSRAKIKVAAAVALGMKFEPRERIVDVACGSGDNLIEAAAQMSGHARLFTIDISQTALGIARTNFQRAQLEVHQTRADWRGLPFRTGSIDKVMAFVAPFPALIGEIDRVLTPEGKLFLVALSRDSITSLLYRIRESVRPDPFDDSRNYSLRDLKSVLEQFFSVEESRVLHAGAERPLSQALDRLIGRWNPDWGRYVVLRCAKQRIAGPSPG